MLAGVGGLPADAETRRTIQQEWLARTPRMDAAHPTDRRHWSRLLTLLLGLAAGSFLGYHLLIAAGEEDTNHLETPLALATARQVTEGPSVLYGPFSAQRPLVLIHAPL